MPRTYNNRKSSGRQLSKTELLIQQEQKEQNSALRQQRHREYLARQQRRDNKARKSALRSSGYKPSWQIERERQLAKSKQQVKQTLSFGVLDNEDDDEKSLHQQQREQYSCRGRLPCNERGDDDYEYGVGEQQWPLYAGVNDGQGIKICERPEVVAEESGK